MDVYVDGKKEPCMLIDVDSSDRYREKRQRILKMADIILWCFNDEDSLEFISRYLTSENIEEIKSKPMILIRLKRAMTETLEDHLSRKAKQVRETRQLLQYVECCAYEKRSRKNVLEYAVKEAKSRINPEDN
ncbi:hypothetical protein CDAR_538371 [Caerostris darwini]|uniref:Uncharacterized protein n=1 Tax=Caerostris darwini TaxID=1538125 RepID=A0AAV4UCR1_9ARAC|nr:hypothetical protein CDAR_538371 [Caerostris darwini]